MNHPITASMLYSYTICPHRVHLDLFGDPRERDEIGPFVELLWERGHAFEAQTMASLHRPFLNLREARRERREAETLRAMRAGEPLIYGGRISYGRLLGEPDLLCRSGAGYVAGDIKSGAGTEGFSEDSDGRPKKHYAVQLALYADILQQLGFADGPRAFVWDIHGREVLYDFRHPRSPRVRSSMREEYEEVLAAVEAIVDRRVSTTPAWISECGLCPWRSRCRSAIRAADDLTLIPELGRQTRGLFPPEIATVSDLARASLSDLLPGGASAVPGIGADRLRTYHARAVLQKEADPTPYFCEPVVLPRREVEIFFDIETDPFRGLCYLHGFVERTQGKSVGERYVPFFAEEPTPAAERDAFAAAWSYLRARSNATVYYYSHYERTVWRQLALRYPDIAAEADVVALFEDDRFIDLYSDVTRSSMIWPTTSLSLKALAAFVGFHWRDPDPSGAGSIEWFHEWVKTGDPRVRQRILEYNEDDCRATRALVDALRRAPVRRPPGAHRPRITG